MSWLPAFVVLFALFVAAGFVVAVIADHCCGDRQPGPIGQPVRHAAPPLPATRWGHADTRHTRPPMTARHRRPGGTR